MRGPTETPAGAVNASDPDLSRQPPASSFYVIGSGDECLDVATNEAERSVEEELIARLMKEAAAFARTTDIATIAML